MVSLPATLEHARRLAGVPLRYIKRLIDISYLAHFHCFFSVTPYTSLTPVMPLCVPYAPYVPYFPYAPASAASSWTAFLN